MVVNSQEIDQDGYKIVFQFVVNFKLIDLIHFLPQKLKNFINSYYILEDSQEELKNKNFIILQLILKLNIKII